LIHRIGDREIDIGRKREKKEKKQLNKNLEGDEKREA
jgi:hypothetical protein